MQKKKLQWLGIYVEHIMAKEIRIKICEKKKKNWNYVNGH